MPDAVIKRTCLAPAAPQVREIGNMDRDEGQVAALDAGRPGVSLTGLQAAGVVPVTAVHKVDVLRVSDGLLLKC